MEYGNIGNFYVVEPFFSNLKKIFPEAQFITTLQMTDDFCSKFNIECLPLETYYSWNENDLSIALEELAVAEIYQLTKNLVKTSRYIEAVMKSDLVIDFSGDMWGDNADLAGNNRFIVNLLKDRTAQLLGKKTFMLIGSPGPFDNTNFLDFAKWVYKNFNLVTNRESQSKPLLKEAGFDLHNTTDAVCPSFLFSPADKKRTAEILISEGIFDIKSYCKFLVGLTFSCFNMKKGFNSKKGFYELDPLQDSDFDAFVDTVEYLINELNAGVVLISHTNGFKTDGSFELIKGRDFQLLQQLYQILLNRNNIDSKYLKLINQTYLPAETKAIIGNFDLFISGRAHGVVAALSQNVPCVALDYINGPPAHKMKGFAEICDMADYVVKPTSAANILNAVKQISANLNSLRQKLKITNIEIAEKICNDFALIKSAAEVE